MEIRADFRSHYGISFHDVGGSVDYAEAVYLTAMLMKDPTSRLQAAKNGWKFPASQEWALLAELYDLTVRVNSKNKPKPLPRPWPSSTKQKIGSTKADTQQVLANLERMNPKE